MRLPPGFARIGHIIPILYASRERERERARKRERERERERRGREKEIVREKREECPHFTS